MKKIDVFEEVKEDYTLNTFPLDWVFEEESRKTLIPILKKTINKQKGFKDFLKTFDENNNVRTNLNDYEKELNKIGMMYLIVFYQSYSNVIYDKEIDDDTRIKQILFNFEYNELFFTLFGKGLNVSINKKEMGKKTKISDFNHNNFGDGFIYDYKENVIYDKYSHINVEDI